MKKFFGILLAAVSALVLLPGCGGGGSNADNGIVTVDQFVGGSKGFVIACGDKNMYIYGAGRAEGDITTDPVNGEYGIVVYAGVGGWGHTEARANYTVEVENDANGNPVITKGNLFLSFENCTDRDLRGIFDFPEDQNDNDDDDDLNADNGAADTGNAFSATLSMTFEFKTGTFTNGDDTRYFWVSRR